jgi:predicted nucleotidyltransferase
VSEGPTLDVGEEELRLLSSILHQHVPGRAVWAFGSRTTGRAKPYSDLDLAVMGDVPLSLDTRAALNDALAQSDLPWKVDVVDWANTGSAFREIIKRDRVVVQVEASTAKAG